MIIKPRNFAKRQCELQWVTPPNPTSKPLTLGPEPYALNPISYDLNPLPATNLNIQLYQPYIQNNQC